MEYAELLSFFTGLVWLAGIITTFVSAVLSVKKISFFTHEKRIQHLEEITKESSELNKLLCRGIKCLLTNARTGNCIDNIKKTEEEIDQFLIDK